MPTNCEKNETRFLNICFPVPTCKSNQFVRFLWQTNTTKCECTENALNNILCNVEPNEDCTVDPKSNCVRNDLIGGSVSCPKGHSSDGRGNCKKTLKNTGKKGELIQKW